MTDHAAALAACLPDDPNDHAPIGVPSDAVRGVLALLPPTRQWYRSTNNGRTWEPTTVHERSPLTALDLEAGEPWDDGMGNLYRYALHGGGA